jgi:hypothetical protein
METIWDRIPLIVNDFYNQYKMLPWDHVSGRTFVSTIAIPSIKDTQLRIQFERDLIEAAEKILPSSNKYYWFIRETSSDDLHSTHITYSLIFAPFLKK